MLQLAARLKSCPDTNCYHSRFPQMPDYAFFLTTHVVMER